MDAEQLIVHKVKKLMSRDDVAFSYYAHTNALVMTAPIFRFHLINWYAWNRYMQGSNYGEYAKHIAASFGEAIQMKELTDKLLTMKQEYDMMVPEVDKEEQP